MKELRSKETVLNILVLLSSGVSAVAASFAIFATGREFLVSSFNLIVLDYLPTWFVTAVIDQFGDHALWLSMVFTGALLSVILGSLAFVSYKVGKAYAPGGKQFVAAGVAMIPVFVIGYLIVGSFIAVLVPAVVASGILLFFDLLPGESTAVDTQRRSVVKAFGGILAFNIVAHGIGLIRREQTQRTEQELQNRAERLEAENMVSRARDYSLEGEGVQPLVSEIGEFFQVDINPSPPVLNVDDWTLSLTGELEEPAELDYSEIRSLESTHEYKAIRCLSDDITGSQLDTAVWTGVSMEAVLDTVEPEGTHAMLYGADDYFYSMSLEDLEACTLAYGMNGFELPQGHGYPVRLLVPNRWGKLHVKWLTEIEIIGSQQGGFWEERGWHGMGPVNAVTKIDRINRPGDRIQIVGHAYAGDRGVDSVEVTIDGGESWEEATLSRPLPNPDTIRQWVFEIGPDREPDGEEFDVYARTIDGNGTIQPEERTEPFPDGATGWVHRSLRP